MEMVLPLASLMTWAGAQKACTASQTPSVKEQQMDFPKSFRKDALSKTQPTGSKILALILCEEGASLRHHVHSA